MVHLGETLVVLRKSLLRFANGCCVLVCRDLAALVAGADYHMTIEV